MKLTKTKLKQIIKEELLRHLLEASDGQRYCCIKGEPFKIHESGDSYILISCSGTTCRQLGKMSKEEFNKKLNSGDLAVYSTSKVSHS
jgi:hypothetical protein